MRALALSKARIANWNASAATIQAALESLSTVGAGNVLVDVVASTSPSIFGRTITLSFRNGKSGQNLPQTTISITSLVQTPSFPAPSAFFSTVVDGASFSEQQVLVLTGASGGTWRVAYNGEVSAPLAPTITAAQLKSTLDAFVGIDNVTVTGGSGSFTVTFGGTQSTTNMQQIFGDAANSSNGLTLRTITTAYDAASQVTSVSDPSSTINFTLDNLGRATTIAQSVNGLTPTVTLNQAFDAMNNRTELKATIASTLDFKNTYQFDKLQRLTDIVQQGQSGGNAVTAKHVTQSFNALSQRTQIARYQSIGTTNAVATTDFTFDVANRLSGIAHKQGATNLNTYTYTYDPLSRIATIISTLDGTDTYSYDQTSQLVGATHTSQANETYGFDANGNRNTAGFTTGTNNQTTAGLGFTYTFDDEGNRTKRTETATGKVQEYDWDHRNRLIAVKDRDTAAGAIVRQVNYQYDAFNRLVRRDYDADGAGAGAATSQYWIYDEGINAVLQFDGSSASNLSHRYLWSNSVDDLVADEQVTSLSTGGNTLWGLADHLGSIRDIADQNESTSVTTIANHRRNNSFGQLISETNATVDMLFAFTGKQYDEVAGLQHNLNRWYDPALGQWISEDPIGFNAGDENIRRYVGNKPAMANDPNGLHERIVRAPRDPSQPSSDDNPMRDWSESELQAWQKKHNDEVWEKVKASIRPEYPSIRAMTSEEAIEFNARHRYEDRLSAPGLTDFGADMAYMDYLRETGRYSYGFDMLRPGGGVDKVLSIGGAMGGGYGPLGPSRSTPRVYPSSAPKGPIQVTEQSIRQALEGSGMSTTQGGISIPKVERFLRRLEAGEVPPPIKVDNGVIVEGHHRYIAGRLFGKEPAIDPGTMSRSQASKVKPIQDIKCSPEDWGD